MRTTGYERLLSKRFGIPNPPTFVTSVSRGAPITFTRLRLDSASPTCDGTIPAEEAYSFHVNFLKKESFSISIIARTVERYFLGEGCSMMLDYSETSATTLHSAMDTVRLYVPRLTIQDFVREEYGSGEVHLKPPQQVMRDPILYHLGASLSALLEHPEENNSLFWSTTSPSRSKATFTRRTRSHQLGMPRYAAAWLLGRRAARRRPWRRT